MKPDNTSRTNERAELIGHQSSLGIKLVRKKSMATGARVIDPRPYKRRDADDSLVMGPMQAPSDP